MTLMIPIVDWNAILFNPNMKQVLNKMLSSGLSRDLLEKSYNAVNPKIISSLTDSQKIQILYSGFDQLTPESDILDFARKWGINNVWRFEESHASILINDEVYQKIWSF